MVDVEQLELEQAEREITAACLSLFDPKKVALVRSSRNFLHENHLHEVFD